LISSDSRTHSFDDSANGTGAGEGIIAIFIKPLGNALKDKDNIYAVIKGEARLTRMEVQSALLRPMLTPKPTQLKKPGLMPISIRRLLVLSKLMELPLDLAIRSRLKELPKHLKKYTSEKSICAIGAIKSKCWSS